MISVLMPIYNGIEFIDESVRSILAQTYSEWELIIGVNGHEENSNVYQIAKVYGYLSPKIRVYDLYKIKGKSNALNEMVTMCSYSHVALLDVDDLWEPTKLEIQCPLINEYDVVGTKCMYFGSNNLLNGVVPAIPTGDICGFDFFSTNPMINSSVIIKKEYCHWNNECVIEDYDLWLTLKGQLKKFYNCPEVLVRHRLHEKSAFNSKGNSLAVPDLLAKHR